VTDQYDTPSPPSSDGAPNAAAQMPSPDAAAAAASRGVRRALAIHRALGIPTAVWRDGRVVIVPAAELPALRTDASSGIG